MILDIATVVALAHQCAPSVAAETLVSVVHTESHFNPYAIGINAKGVAAPDPASRASAAAAARRLIARGYNIDLGLGQINSANLKWLGLSVEDAFDPCRNLAAAARVLSGNYLSVVRSSPTTEAAIATAVSMYNTGSRSRGFGNGYVGRVYASSTVVVPAIRHGLAPAMPTTPAPPPALGTQAPAASAPTITVDWDTSADAQTAKLMVFGSASSSSQKGQSE
ncbi:MULTISPECIES: lytic transglycosylase domain-containing protein [unclassified Sphingomonas]|jgi:type IV secretion system protein VirB1|uniref:lytic transglycosylase domain-containing protein n=2 Tax=Sphingomonas TaxID=13687 RepID=UPI00082B3A3E|nr:MULTISPECIES: lytic transglycosylase domain-containing protein [unclassified Sphingomonas]